MHRRCSTREYKFTPSHNRTPCAGLQAVLREDPQSAYTAKE
nr:MAG TPA: hypothetical protein [Caudoviricetes sp.]